MTIAAFARELNVDEKAIRKGIASSRIPASCLGRSSTGRRTVIADPAAARQAWAANASRLPRDGAAGEERGSLVEASRLATIERGRRLRMENDRREGQLLERAAAEREAFESARIIRETLLNLPIRLAAELAAENDPQKIYARLDDAIRQALHETADRLEAAGE